MKSLQNMKIIEVKGLLALKLSKFNQYQNNFRIEIINPIQNLPNAMPIYEYNRCLGILLDNAMEALDFGQIDSSDKKTYLSIVFYQKEQQLVMVIKNRYFQKINLSEIYKYGFTNKKGHQGLGLANINEILQQYPHSSIDTEITPDFFIQKLTLSKV
ncbi:GHKL domain-containing protein [Bombilactobacillus bombi]|uniref:GHKL domain-containing protein n=1 Tax=Bombilactobacillus bombi TaxID=1303590 RepID=UPI0011C4562D|nr:GHKL domain-containing protein [Bombilactobacillus bombi]